ncbi:hypothetical protein LTR16_012499, partial [Cryomyces antarcticus]
MFARQRNNNTTDPARTLAPASEPVKAMHDGKKAEAEDREMQEAGAEDGEKDDDDDDDDDSSDADNDPVALGFKITVGAADKVVEVRWLQGRDSVLFESFCGMLRRA